MVIAASSNGSVIAASDHDPDAPAALPLSLPVRVASCAVSSYVLWSYLTLVLALAKRLTANWAIATMLTSGIAFGLLFYRFVYKGYLCLLPRAAVKDDFATLVASLVWVLPLTVFVAVPPFLKDDLIYHLQVPKRMALAGGLTIDPYNVASNFPMLFEMPLAALAAAHWTVSPYLPNLVFLQLLGWLLIDSLRRQAKVPLWVAFLIGGAVSWTPMVLNLSHSAYADLFVALLIFIAAQYTATQQVTERGNFQNQIIALGFFACAAASKNIALPATMVFAGSIYFGRKRRDDWFKIMGVLLGAALLAAPFYVKNAIYLGNPFFPLAREFFDHAALSSERYGFMVALSRSYNLGRELGDYLLMPWRMLSPFATAPSGGALGFDGQLSYIFILGYLGLGWRRRGQALYSLIFCVQFALVAFQSQIVRYVFPYLLPLVVYGAARLHGKRWLSLALASLAGVSIVSSVVALSQNSDYQAIASFLKGASTKDEFLERTIGEPYRVARDYNVRRPSLGESRGQVLLVGAFGRGYYFEAPVLSFTYFDAEPLVRAFDSKHPRRDVLSRLFCGQRVPDVILDEAYMARVQADFPDFDHAAMNQWLALYASPEPIGTRSTLWRLNAERWPTLCAAESGS